MFERRLSEHEKAYFLDCCNKDGTRKILHIFFSIWKLFFLIGSIGMAFELVRIIREKSFMELFIIGGLPILYLFFWLLPKKLLNQIDYIYRAIKNDEVYIREAKLLSVRLHRERISSSSYSHRTVCYATIPSGLPNETYEVLASRHVSYVQTGDFIYVLRFPKGRGAVNTEYAIPHNFMNEIISFPI